MLDALAVFSRWWKRIITITALATVLAAVVSLLLPPRYVSVATALPASSFAADKAAIFNSNIQQLYSSLGTADDLDRIVGTARLDTIYIAAAKDLSLAKRWGFEKVEFYKAVQKLKRQSNISKSEWGELKIKVWDSDRNVAAQAANALLEKLQQLHQSLQNQSNRLVLHKLWEVYQQTRQQDTPIQHTPSTAAPAMQAERLKDYDRLLAEYNLMVAANPPVLLVVEAARPASQADNLEKLAYVLVTFFAALLFSLLLAVYSEGKKAS
jgi:hypothetical protein